MVMVMNNALLKALLVSFVFTFVSSATAAEKTVDGCVRIYCMRDQKTKLKNVDHHQQYYPAEFDKKSKNYLVSDKNFHDALVACKLEGNLSELSGTDANKFETTAPWIVVKRGPSGVVYKNTKCKDKNK